MRLIFTRRTIWQRIQEAARYLFGLILTIGGVWAAAVVLFSIGG